MPISLGTTTITAIYLGTTSIVSAYLGSTQVFGGASAFTPLSLFSGGAQGVWYDPSDLTTMFVDRAGTAPVTAPGQLVGLRLDKSKGLVLGPELVVNGTFDSGTTGWTSGSGGTFVVTAGQLVVTNPAGGTNRRAFQTFSATVGTTYRIEGQMVSGGRIGVGTTAAATETVLVSGSVNQVFTATASTMYVGLSVASATAGETATFDNISVRELPGNHAVAPTDAARPMYGVEPKGGRRNLLLATDTLATQSLTVTAVAHTLAFTGTGTVTLTGASTAGPLVGTGAGNRVSLTFTPTAASLTLTVSGSVTLGQLERASSATAYQKVVTAYEVTEAGVATCHYVQYDGSDDSMSTSAIDFTGTDKMSVFAGVRKLSDAAAGIVVELSAIVDSNNGSFFLAAPGITAGAEYRYRTKGTAQANAIATIYPAPLSNVLTGISDIAADINQLRVNGALAASTATDLGTGNFGNYPLYIGRRNGATLPFNGRDYGLVIVGKLASAGEISDTETWLAAKTAQVTL